MAKPKGHKAAQVLQQSAFSDARVKEELLKEWAEGKEEPETGTVMKCVCRETLEFPGAVQRSGTVYRLTCPFCKHSKHLKWDEGCERVWLQPDDIAAWVEVECHTYTPYAAHSRWRSAMPGEEHAAEFGQVLKKVRARRAWLTARKKKLSGDAKYLNLMEAMNRAMNLVLAGYETIDPAVAEQYRGAMTRRNQREEYLAVQGLLSENDPVMGEEGRAMSDAGNLLINIWADAGERVGLSVSKKKSRAVANATAAVAGQEKKKRERFAQAHEEFKRYRLEQQAEETALADKRGHVAPLVPHAWWLAGAVYEKAVKSKKRFPVNTLKVDLAKLVRRDNPTTWPTLHHLVMAFAERGPVILAEIRNFRGSREKNVTDGRPVRYSPRVVQHLIRWWLEGPGGKAEEKTRREFQFVATLLPS